MKAVIKTVNFDKEVKTKFGTMYQFKVTYNDKTASYLSKKREQTLFVANKESEFVETPREYNGNTYYNVKGVPKVGGNSNFGRALKREQSKYSGFAMSYAKDLVVADKIKIEDMSSYTKMMFALMVELDKSLEK